MVDVDNERFTLPRYDPDERSVTPHCAKHPARMAVWAHEQVTSPDVLNPFQRAVGHEDLLTRDVTTRGRFHQEGAALFQCFRHRPGHLNLRRPRLKPGHRTADRAARGQQGGRAVRQPHRANSVAMRAANHATAWTTPDTNLLGSKTTSHEQRVSF